jgi:MFS superfamily sulfate permease-like transporter
MSRLTMRALLATRKLREADMIGEERYERVQEIIRDAEACHRLTAWERQFVNDMQNRLELFGARIHISDAQEVVLNRIEAKVYAI